jgi:hypothetical protein
MKKLLKKIGKLFCVHEFVTRRYAPKTAGYTMTEVRKCAKCGKVLWKAYY